MSLHLWYLSDEAVAFSFFDDSVPIEIKKKMVRALKINRVCTKRITDEANT